MPKEIKPHSAKYTSPAAPYPTPSSNPAGPRNAAIWSTTDDEVLLRARVSGLNWQPIASKYFPNKTANACRKRHERLIERRHVEDWDAQKLELLAQEYIAVRKEMWEVLASRVGERWSVVEAKCMEKGLKNLQATARTAQRRGTASPLRSFDNQGINDHHSVDSGIGLGSDAEMEVDDAESSRKPASWHAHTAAQQSYQEHVRSRSLPQPLPLYQPPPPLNTTVRRALDADAPMTTSPAAISYVRHTSTHRYSPEAQNGRAGMSIQSVLSPPDPQRA
ncbi:hypothetical protein LTR37_002041 [Vermiconidia calcicola]|uniref:Uncharacterized protein n=1 Tax=Vermiconidia calcicola TaxID=1690605 RepID=A0ACC3NWB2_9PEZI|nr:hypothetical protein LTR37_002041 [Vermiconidia calcicola]